MNLVIVENLNIVNINIVEKYSQHGFTVKYFFKSEELSSDFGNIEQISWIAFKDGQSPYYLRDCEKKALNNITNYFNSFYRKKFFLKVLKKMYSSEDIEICVKKNILQELAHFFIINFYLDCLKKNGAGQIVFISDNYCGIKEKLLKLKIKIFDDSEIKIIQDKISFKKILRGLSKINFFLFFFKAVKNLFVKGAQNRIEYLLGIRSYKTDFGINTEKNLRTIDFVIDEKEIFSKDVLFCIETDISREYKQKYYEKKYSYYDFNSESIETISIKNYFYYIIALFFALVEKANYFDFVIHLTHIKFKWDNFFKKNSLKKYLLYNDFSSEHIARNIILKKNSVETFFYTHSAHNLNVFEKADESIDCLHHHYSLYYYDNFITYGGFISDFYNRHEQYIGKYIEIGCYWSDLIPVKSYPANEDYKITFFDTSWGFEHPYLGNSFIVKDDYDEFLSSIAKLAGIYKNYQINFKSKNDDHFRCENKKIYEVFCKQKNVRILKGDEDTLRAIGESDLVISIAYTSTTIEALGKKIKGLYFDPLNKYRGTVFDKIPKFVAHNYNELCEYIEFWLSIPAKDFDEIIEKFIKPEIDPFCDGQAINRFRKILTNKNFNSN